MTDIQWRNFMWCCVYKPEWAEELLRRMYGY
jgi:hypothetical protein